MFPYVPTFSSPHIPPDGDDIKKHPPPREKSYNGMYRSSSVHVHNTDTIVP